MAVAQAKKERRELAARLKALNEQIKDLRVEEAVVEQENEG